MKVKVKRKEGFTPIKLTITIESEEELCNLWHRSNITAGKIHTSNYICGKDLKYEASDSDTSLWEKLDELVKIHGLEK